MRKNSSKLSMDEARRLAETPAGKQLVSKLQSADPKAMEQALGQLAAGNAENAKELLLPLLQDPQITALLQQLGG